MKSPIKVLLLGKRWDLLDQAFSSLSSKGAVEFVGPVAQEIPEAVSRSRPSAIMVRPCPRGAFPTLAGGPVGEVPSPPPVLLCLDHASMETEDLFGHADDFVLLPCSAAELEKRLLRLVRAQPTDAGMQKLRLGKITLDTGLYEVRIDGKREYLAWMEFKLLKYLMQNPGRIFTRDQLLATVWGVDSIAGTRTVDVHIRRLRQKLGPHATDYIRTVPNVGYGLINA